MPIAIERSRVVCAGIATALFATGAITVADLLERVPGLSTLRTGWIAAPAVGAYLGDVRRVRVFYDGFEITPLDPRSRGALDLTEINLWSAEEVVDRAGARGGARLSAQLARPSHDAGDAHRRQHRRPADEPVSRILWPAFRQWRGAFSSPRSSSARRRRRSSGRAATSSGLIGRVGWANGPVERRWIHRRASGRHRGDIFGDRGRRDTIPALESTRTDSYVRVGYRRSRHEPRCGRRSMAVGAKYDYTGIRTVPTTNLKTRGGLRAGDRVARHAACFARSTSPRRHGDAGRCA